jgi:hypothetical protein
MLHDIKRLRSYLDQIGVAGVPHTRHSLMAHLTGTYEQLALLNLPEHVVVAGLFHSVYGTEGFPHPAVPLARRDEIRALIGDEAERLAYRYCALSFASLQQSVEEGRPVLEDRFEGGPMPLTKPEFEELLWVKLADAIAQADEATAGSLFFKKVAELLGSAGEVYWDEFTRAKYMTNGVHDTPT